MAEIIGFVYRAMRKASKTFRWSSVKEDNSEKPSQEGDARKITAGIGIPCAQSEKGRRVVLLYLVVSSFHQAEMGSTECCQWGLGCNCCRSSDLITKESFSSGNLASGTKGEVYLIGFSSDLGLTLPRFGLRRTLTVLKMCWYLWRREFWVRIEDWALLLILRLKGENKQ